MALLALVLVSGCFTAPAEEHEHHFPAHKPANFPAAALRVRALHHEILAGSPRPVEQLDVFAEFSDVVKWLPELAGDSDLLEPEWNRVQETSARLEELLQPVLQAELSERSLAYRTQAPAIEMQLAELADVEREFPPREGEQSSPESQSLSQQ